MKTHKGSEANASIEQVKKLIEAGESATQGEWFGIDADCHEGASWHDLLLIENGMVVNSCYTGDDDEFVIQAANSREAIKQLVAEYEELVVTCERMRNASQNLINDIKQRYPDEPFRCEYLRELDKVLTEEQGE